MLSAKHLSLLLCSVIFAFYACGSDDDSVDDGHGSDTPQTEVKFNITQEQINASYNGGTYGNITVSTTGSSLSASSDNKDWITVSLTNQSVRVGVLTITVAPNTGEARQGSVSIISGSASKKITVIQEATPAEETDPEEMTVQSSFIPSGYTMVWNDEFNTGDAPSSAEWWYEEGRGSNGWGNNEEQYYVKASSGSKVGFCKNGYMNIVARKNGTRIESIRMNTNDSWQYGYFEARLKLPTGKGTWPAFWMMPKNFISWPADGEIDIMEEVGYNPNVVLSTIHCNKYWRPGQAGR